MEKNFVQNRVNFPKAVQYADQIVNGERTFASLSGEINDNFINAVKTELESRGYLVLPENNNLENSDSNISPEDFSQEINQAKQEFMADTDKLIGEADNIGVAVIPEVVEQIKQETKFEQDILKLKNETEISLEKLKTENEIDPQNIKNSKEFDKVLEGLPKEYELKFEKDLMGALIVGTQNEFIKDFGSGATLDDDGYIITSDGTNTMVRPSMLDYGQTRNSLGLTPFELRKNLLEEIIWKNSINNNPQMSKENKHEPDPVIEPTQSKNLEKAPENISDTEKLQTEVIEKVHGLEYVDPASNRGHEDALKIQEMEKQLGIEIDPEEYEQVVHNEKVKKEVYEILNRAPKISNLNLELAPFKNYKNNDQNSWEYIPTDEIEKYLDQKFFFDTGDISGDDVISTSKINLTYNEERVKIPLDLIVKAAGFKNWKGRDKNTDKTWHTKDYGRGYMGSHEVVKLYAGLPSELPGIDTVNMYVQPDGKVFFDNNGGDSHRIAAAILRGQPEITARHLYLKKLSKNYI